MTTKVRRQQIIQSNRLVRSMESPTADMRPSDLELRTVVGRTGNLWQLPYSAQGILQKVRLSVYFVASCDIHTLDSRRYSVGSRVGSDALYAEIEEIRLNQQICLELYNHYPYTPYFEILAL
jgi:hypothetical protein